MNTAMRWASRTAVAATAGLLACTGAAHAAGHRACALLPHDRLAPYLVSPCHGATVPRAHAVVFTVIDRNPAAVAQAPYLNLQTRRTMVDGHLAPDQGGNGIFAEMNRVKGHPDRFTYTAVRESYASDWENHPGLDYVQVEQVDPSSPSGVLYGPITGLHVSRRG